MTIRNENGDRFISVKWLCGILITILLSVMGAWAAQRHSWESEATRRINLLEWNQSRVMALLELNRETLLVISQDLKNHRSTGK